MTKAAYLVTGDAFDLRGWTPETLADALRAPLGELGVEVWVKPHMHGGGGYLGTPELEASVLALVERTVEG